jgi:hypothetical protein
LAGGPTPRNEGIKPPDPVPASTGSVEASGPADSRSDVIQALRHHVAEGSRGRLKAQDIHEDGQLFDRGYLDSFS